MKMSMYFPGLGQLEFGPSVAKEKIERMGKKIVLTLAALGFAKAFVEASDCQGTAVKITNVTSG